MPLNHFDEHRWAVLNRFGKDLQKITFIIAVNENAQVVDGFVILFDFADAVGERFIIGIRHAQKFYAILAKFIHSFENITGDDGDVLRAGRKIIIKIFFDLTLAASLSRFVDGKLDAPVAVLHHLGHERRIFSGNVLVVEVHELTEAQHLMIKINPVIHLAKLHIANDMVNRRETCGLGFILNRLIGWSENTFVIIAVNKDMQGFTIRINCRCAINAEIIFFFARRPCRFSAA